LRVYVEIKSAIFSGSFGQRWVLAVLSLVTGHDIYVAGWSYVDLPIAGNTVYPIVEKFEFGFIRAAIHGSKKVGAFPEIILLIHFSLHVKKLLHGKAYRCAVVVGANFFFDIILLSIGIINNILLDKRSIL